MNEDTFCKNWFFCARVRCSASKVSIALWRYATRFSENLVFLIELTKFWYEVHLVPARVSLLRAFYCCLTAAH